MLTIVDDIIRGHIVATWMTNDTIISSWLSTCCGAYPAIKIRSRVSAVLMKAAEEESKKNRSELETRINISTNDKSIIGAKLMIAVDNCRSINSSVTQHSACNVEYAGIGHLERVCTRLRYIYFFPLQNCSEGPVARLLRASAPDI